MATQIRVPESDVDTNDFTASSGTDEFAMVDEDTTNANLSGNDGDTTYCTNLSGFNVFLICQSDDQVPAGATINSLTVNVMAKDTGVAGPHLDPLFRVNGTNYAAGIGGTALTTSYALYSYGPLSNNPDTSAAWTLNDVNGSGANPLQGFGCRCENLGRVTAMNLVIDYTPAAGGRATKNIRAFPLGMELGMGLGIGGGQ